MIVSSDKVQTWRTGHCSYDDQKCGNVYATTTIWNTDGTYIVRIPFKERPDKLRNSNSKAAARLISMEKKFKRNSEVKQLYYEFMIEYLDLGYMSHSRVKYHGET